uniref:G_PROTEIN_RECEP_F1_2 domain-containing protein n=1 Tax=Ascaris lumbricoides TaxID=6252 RepID=A0A0M3IM92_ASCLU
MNYSMKCWSERHQLLSGSTLEMIVFTLLFPPICILGIAGNTLNLMVLLSSEMRSRANSLLACLAFCDIVFLLLMIPHSLANFNVFALNYFFRWYYLSAKIHLITLANWSSAVAIWLVVAVCAERVMGIRHPFHTRAHWSRYCTAAIVFTIVLLAGMLTFYNNFSHICVVKEFCNRTQVMAKCFDVTLDTLVYFLLRFLSPIIL